MVVSDLMLYKARRRTRRRRWSSCYKRCTMPRPLFLDHFDHSSSIIIIAIIIVVFSLLIFISSYTSNKYCSKLFIVSIDIFRDDTAY